MKRSMVVCIALIALILFTINTAHSWDPKHLKRLLTIHRCPSCDLTGAKLQGQNLKGVNIAGANLTGADLSKATLNEANLAGGQSDRGRPLQGSAR